MKRTAFLFIIMLVFGLNVKAQRTDAMNTTLGKAVNNRQKANTAAIASLTMAVKDGIQTTESQKEQIDSVYENVVEDFIDRAPLYEYRIKDWIQIESAVRAKMAASGKDVVSQFEWGKNQLILLRRTFTNPVDLTYITETNMLPSDKLWRQYKFKFEKYKVLFSGGTAQASPTVGSAVSIMLGVNPNTKSDGLISRLAKQSSAWNVDYLKRTYSDLNKLLVKVNKSYMPSQEKEEFYNVILEEYNQLLNTTLKRFNSQRMINGTSVGKPIDFINDAYNKREDGFSWGN